jgi:hypothetical protein
MTSITRAFSSSALRRLATSAAIGASLAASSPALAQGYSEPPDLSNDPAAPTPVTLSVGDNLISGTTGRLTMNDPVDQDYFTFTLGANEVLSAITILEGTTTSGVAGVAFIALDSGSSVTYSGTDATGLLGWTHYNGANTGQNILPIMSVPNQGSSGFGAIGDGTYSVWIQEASPGMIEPYRFNFLVRETPEPATWAMMLAGFGCVGLAFRRRRKLEAAKALA